MSDLIFLRHGQTLWNLERRLQGRGDSPLTELGRAQARSHAAALADRAVRAILCSPAPRAQTTAAIIGEALGIEVEVEADLAERCMGRFEGWTLAEIEQRHPEEHARRLADPWSWRAPDGENYDDLMARVEPVVARLRALAGVDGGPVVVVSHGTLIRPLLGQLLDLEPATMLRIRHPNELRYRLDLSGACPRIFFSGDCSDTGQRTGPGTGPDTGVETPGLLLLEA